MQATTVKKKFAEPEIVSETSLDDGQKNFPLMPLTAGSGPIGGNLPKNDSADSGFDAAGSNDTD